MAGGAHLETSKSLTVDAARRNSSSGELEQNESRIVGELIGVQGQPVDVSGSYLPDPALTAQAMRPSATFNAIVDRLGSA